MKASHPSTKEVAARVTEVVVLVEQVALQAEDMVVTVAKVACMLLEKRAVQPTLKDLIIHRMLAVTVRQLQA